MIKRMTQLLAATALCAAGSTAAAQSGETCGGNYVVRPGDTLSEIADTYYDRASLWTAIYQANAQAIGRSANNIRVGQTLRLTCIGNKPTGLAGGIDLTEVAAATPLQIAPGTAATRFKVNLVTGDDYKPFTDRNLPNGGMLTDVVTNAMEAADPAEGFAVHFVNDWNAHFEPLLSNALIDLSFPWIRPDCDSQPDTYRCTDLKFSDPMFEMLVLLFVNKNNQFAFNSTEDVRGKTLCRPTGYATFFFDKDGRNWLKDNIITLEQPGTPADCFEGLADGTYDGVVMNEFSGRGKIKELGLLDDIVVAGGQPIAIDGLHVVVHKDHPRADEVLKELNDGLVDIKANGTYQKVIDEHLTRIWADF